MKFISKELYLGSMDDLVKIIENNSLNNIKKNYFAINSDCMLVYWKDNVYKEILDEENSLVYVDGMGVIYAQKILGLKVASERIATTDLFPALIEYLSEKKSNLKIYLLGGKGDTSRRVMKKFLQLYPNANIVGAHHGYFDSDDEIINEINSLNIDILFVGFGTPTQEKWVNKNTEKLRVNSIITCGGLFDYYSGNVKRAPKVLQSYGFEWLYRLIQEPKRLYKRYIFGNIKYIFTIIRLKLEGLRNGG